MKFALIGYGRMGHEIERLMVARGHELALIADEYNPLTVDGLRDSGAEVAIEFTTPDSAFGNIAACLEAGVAVVSGTTGWLSRWDEAVALCEKLGGAMFYASNYSVGVNLFFRLNEQLARMMAGFPQYGVAISETHHIHKKDAPSGTAITLAEGVLHNMGRYEGWELMERTDACEGETGVAKSGMSEMAAAHSGRDVTGAHSGDGQADSVQSGRDGAGAACSCDCVTGAAHSGHGVGLPVSDGKISVEAIRDGEVPGTHTVTWRSEVDMITMTHEAFNRTGLAAGAVMAAEFLCGRKGVWSMDDLLDNL